MRMLVRTVARPWILTVLLSMAVAAACAKSGPTMSGFAFGDTRIVQLGEVIELRLPLRKDGSRHWRVSSYDSFYLELTGRPQVIVTPKGGVELIRARTTAPGETVVEVSEVPGPETVSREPRIERFELRIME